MKAFLKSIGKKVCNSVEYGWEKPITLVSEWQTSQKEAATFNSKVMNAIFNTISMEDFFFFFWRVNGRILFKEIISLYKSKVAKNNHAKSEKAT